MCWVEGIKLSIYDEPCCVVFLGLFLKPNYWSGTAHFYCSSDEVSAVRKLLEKVDLQGYQVMNAMWKSKLKCLWIVSFMLFLNFGILCGGIVELRNAYKKTILPVLLDCLVVLHLLLLRSMLPYILKGLLPMLPSIEFWLLMVDHHHLKFSKCGPICGWDVMQSTLSINLAKRELTPMDHHFS